MLKMVLRLIIAAHNISDSRENSLIYLPQRQISPKKVLARNSLYKHEEQNPDLSSSK